MELVRRMGGERPSRPTPVAGSAAEGGDRYAIEREVGRGSVATVYLARDRKHNRAVALKVLKPKIAAGSDRRRFEREIGLLARMRHPHVLPLFDSGVLSLAGGRDSLFYVMPYVEGESLRDRLERDASVSAPRRPSDRVRGRRCAGVRPRPAHRAPRHRPENILLSGGHAVVADFGIARVLEVSGGEAISATGLVLGHPRT